MKKIMLLPAAVMALMAGLVFSTTGMAEYGHGMGEGAGSHMMGSGPRSHMMGEGAGRHMMRDGCGGSWWDETVTQAQKDKILKMKVDHLKLKYPKKAKIKAIKAELMVLVTADTPDQKAITAKINEILALKKEIMAAGYAHKIAVRKELKPEQRAAYDKHLLKKAGGQRCGHHY